MDVFAVKAPVSAAEEADLEPGKNKLLKAHPVVAEKARRGKGRGSQQADPACVVLSQRVLQTEIEPGGQSNGDYGANQLPRGQPEYNCFTVRPYFLRYFDFDKSSPLSL